MKYRPEIDGLRTIAVIPVILFHAGFSFVGGGYVGVDIFFVISGYLITSIIAQDLVQGTFSFRRFYERRARRILPALLLVSLACIPFAWAWMLPEQFRVFLGSLFGVGVFLSNFYFLTQVEYFQPAAELQPLLHTWSLSIEEQYYLLFPALLLLLWKAGKHAAFGAILFLVLGGIYLAQAGITDDPGKNYFHSAARLWEIGAGSLCALWVLGRPRRENHLLAALGLALIGYAVFGFTDLTPFPGVYTLVPVIGTMLMILFAGAERGVGIVLSNRIMVGLGLLSYSAYLWHQPLFAFARLRSIDPVGVWGALALAVLSFVLAYLSWRFVENPFRKGPRKLIPSRPLFMLTAFGAVVVVTAFGLFGYLRDGFPDRSQNGLSLAVLDQRLAINAGLHPLCAGGRTDADLCQTVPDPAVMLWGDSFAMHLVPGLLANNPDLALVQRTMSGCPPVVDLVFVASALDASFGDACIAFNRAVLKELDSTETLTTVVMSSEFLLPGKRLWQADGTEISSDQAAARLESGLRQTIALLRSYGLEVILVSPPPGPGFDAGQCLVRTLRFDAAADRCDFARDTIENPENFPLMDRIAADVDVVRLDDAICDAGQCRASREGVFIYRDTGHLAIEGSAALANVFAPFAALRAP